MYKRGTGTRGQGHRDVCGGDLGLGDAKRGTWGHQVRDVQWGRVGQGRGTSNTGTQGTRNVNDYRKSRK